MKNKATAWILRNKAGLSFILFVASALLFIPLALLNRLSGPYTVVFNVSPDQQHYSQRVKLSPKGNSYQVFATYEHNRDAVAKTAAIAFSLFEGSNLITQNKFGLEWVSGGPGAKYLVKDDAIYGKFNVSKEGDYIINIALLERPVNFHEFQIYINAGQNESLLYLAYAITLFFFTMSLVLGIANFMTYLRRKQGNG